MIPHPAVTAQLIAVVDALLLRQRQTLPSLVKVTQTRVQLPVVNTTCTHHTQHTHVTLELKTIHLKTLDIKIMFHEDISYRKYIKT